MTGLEVYLWLCLDSVLHLLGMAVAISMMGIIIYIIFPVAPRIEGAEKIFDGGVEN